MRYRLVAAFAVLASLTLTMLTAVVPVPASAFTSCAGPRVFVESQAWWTPNPGTTGGNDFGHVHVGACIPERDVISSRTRIRVRVILHHNPGYLRDVSLVYKTTNSEVTVAKLVPSIRRCPVDQTCEAILYAPIVPAKFDRRGLQEIRLRVYVDQPDGKRMHTSLNFQSYIRNNKPVSHVSRRPYLRSKGWYTGFGYCEAGLLSVPVPDRPVSGLWRVKLQQVDHGPDDVDPTYHSVKLDSNSHVGLPGTVLAEGRGPLSPTTLQIDTTKLADGPHRLVQRVDCASGNQVNSGVQVLNFDVANGS